MSTSWIRAAARPAALFVLLATAGGCCPSGVWQDNFGTIYQILTLPVENPEPGQPLFLTSGVADTVDMGCGVWNVRPPQTQEMPTDPDQYDVIWVAQNPHPNPTDACCYATLFTGNLAGGGCLLVSGNYRSIGGKCSQAGQMYLQVVQSTR